MKIKFFDLVRNNTGKLSGSGSIGWFAGACSILVIISGVVAFYLKIPESLTLIDKGLMGLTISAALLGVRKLSKNDQLGTFSQENSEEFKNPQKTQEESKNGNNGNQIAG